MVDAIERFVSQQRRNHGPRLFVGYLSKRPTKPLGSPPTHYNSR
jgi:hypothetical protein